MTRKSYRSIDRNLNPSLASRVASVRGIMTDVAERAPLPKRFDAIEHKDEPAMIITDLKTHRSTVVSLCDYGGARQVLIDLFPDK